MSGPLRKTQRAPRSCTMCSRRKVKCDKVIPCTNCIRRNQPAACVRETVLIRGEEITYPHDAQVPTYRELSSENQRLRNELDVLRAQASAESTTSVEESLRTLSTSSRRRTLLGTAQGSLEKRLWDDCASSANGSCVASWNDIILPSRETSEHLISFDQTWNSWVHYAIEYPQMSDECDGFLHSLEQGTLVHHADPAWLAVYFSILSSAALMISEEDSQSILPDPKGLSRNWYDAAIFCLHRADFMRVASIRSVQAIAILGMSFNNWGDLNLGQHMWGCALRIAQQLGLNTMYSEQAEKCLSEEGQHRLWWTLVICDWLNLMDRPLGIDDIDFNVPYPAPPLIDGNLADSEHPVHYHTFMARSATVLYNFRKRIRSGPATLAEKAQIVRSADEELAKIIETLPTHLQPDSHTNEHEDWLNRLECDKPWIKWQRFDLTFVLFHLRLLINRTLSDLWTTPSGETMFGWARTVCLRSALSAIWINKNWDEPASSRKQWALSYHIFTAAIFLLGECESDIDGISEEYLDAVRTALQLLEEVSSQNAVAHHASLIIRENLQLLV
ncbi:hypothetical protein DM02DRAFT_593251 [Periconia macrospinosa]|uniref:Zn(2)-C6 fungal-type domain-containing protein n=1 Tax=Periconia macrospinosa TaxID=97972 RepID=A0A2V1DSA9_9PLEO|nr:hypothetical protein DM02DRAFT_593251 [Periconia macrospinosa]